MKQQGKISGLNLPKLTKAHPVTTQPLEQSSKMKYKGMGSGSVVKKGVKSHSKSR